MHSHPNLNLPLKYLLILFLSFLYQTVVQAQDQFPAAPAAIPESADQVNPNPPQTGTIPSGANNSQILTSKDNTFQILIPPGWLAAGSPTGVLEGYYISPGTEETRPTILIIRDEHRDSGINEIINNCIKEVQTQFPKAIASPITTLNVHDGKAARFTMAYSVSKTNTVTNQQDVTQVNQMYYVYKGSKAYYVLVGTYYPSSHLPDLSEFFDNLAKTASAK